MAFTSHGHQIPGSVRAGRSPAEVKPCGGTAICKVCQAEMEKYFEIKIPGGK